MNAEQEINRSLALKDTWDGPWPATKAVPLSFFAAPLVSDLDDLDADVAFLGVPYDQGTFARPGSAFRAPTQTAYDTSEDVLQLRFLPQREESRGAISDIDRQQTFLKGVTMADCGDVTIIPSDVESNFAKINPRRQKDNRPGFLPRHRWRRPLHNLPGGAGDSTATRIWTWCTSTPTWTSATSFRERTTTTAVPFGRCFDLPNVRNVTSIGIRKATKGIFDDAVSKGVKLITTEQFRALGPEGAVAHVPAGGNVYLTVDVDVMDPMQVPGTGSPAPGGFFYYEMRDALIALSKRVNIVGCDFVEVAPPYDHAETSTMCTAKLMLDLLAELFPSK